MKPIFYCIFCLIVQPLFGDEVKEPKSVDLIQPLLPLSLEYPVTMDDENRHLTHEILRLQSLQNLNVVEKKKIPFEFMFVVSVLVAVWVVFDQYPHLVFSKEKEKFSSEEILARTKQKIIETLTSNEETKQELEQQLIDLNSLVKGYLHQMSEIHLKKNPSSINILSLTTEELTKQKIENLNVKKGAYTHMLELFKLTDQMKYGRYSPSLEECRNLVITLKSEFL